MARTRFTTTGDVTHPKVLALANGVRWYAYLRGPVLCVRRGVDGVWDAEVPVTHPVASLDVEVSPDGTTGWIYFIHDGVLEKIEVTNLTTDSISTVALSRQAGWYEVVRVASTGTGFGASWTLVAHPPLKVFRTDDPTPTPRMAAGLGGSWAPTEGPDAPSLAIEAFYGFPTRTLIVDLPNRSTYRNRGIARVDLRRLEASTEHPEVYTQLAVGESTVRLYATVPATATPVTIWTAVCVRLGGQPSTGVASNPVVDDGNLPTIYLEMMQTTMGGAGLSRQWATTDHQPSKNAAAEVLSTMRAGGTLATRWAVNGHEILTP